jgi:hypothetical protein
MELSTSEVQGETGGKSRSLPFFGVVWPVARLATERSWLQTQQARCQDGLDARSERGASGRPMWRRWGGSA